jgi:hypothetical protein
LRGAARLGRHADRLLAIGLWLLIAAPAAAAVVTASSGTGYKGDSLANFGFAAEPGEANRLRIAITDTQISVVDDAAPIVARGACRSEGDHAAVCSLHEDPSLSRLHNVALGDGDDRVEVSSTGRAYTTVDLGPGDDAFSGQAGRVEGGDGADALTTDAYATLSGGLGADRLQGSADPDTLYGGPGADVIAAGAGADVVGAADGEPDVLDGGPGRDRLSYAGASSPVSADLADAVAEGQAGEGDQATGFEDVEGGQGNDVLGGDAGDNRSPAGAAPTGSRGAAATTSWRVRLWTGWRLRPAARARSTSSTPGPATTASRPRAARPPRRPAAPGATSCASRARPSCGRRRTARGCASRRARAPATGTVRLLGGGRVAVRCPAARTRSRRCRVAATARRAGRTLGSARATAPPRGTARLTLGRRVRGRVVLELAVRQTGRQPFRAPARPGAAPLARGLAGGLGQGPRARPRRAPARRRSEDRDLLVPSVRSAMDWDHPG